LGIPPAANPNYRPWTKSELRLLGTMPDADVARRLGRNYSAVLSKRQQFKIPYKHPRYASWKPSELELLNRLSNKEVAKRTSRTINAVRGKWCKLMGR
jgi:hypothetical protein